MSATFEISSRTGDYKVTIGRGIITQTAQSHPGALFIVDDKLQDRLPDDITRILPIEAAETSKALDAMSGYIGQMRQLGANRDTHLVVIGGGTIQDAATFLASIYMRGLSWTYMPSTVLSMDDSCIGGKSSINVLDYKNLVGNFYPPQDIVIDLDLVTTLDREMIVGGLFEACKICFAHSAERFETYMGLAPEAASAPEEILPIVELSLRTKKWFIETDEFDQKERLLLNFGHTFGHAIEGATEFQVSHGIGVGVGMLAACHFSKTQNLLSTAGQSRVEVLRQHILSMLGIDAAPVIPAPPGIDLALIMQKFEYDKKHKADTYRLILPKGDGDLALQSLPRSEDTRKAVEAAYQHAFEELRWVSAF